MGIKKFGLRNLYVANGWFYFFYKLNGQSKTIALGTQDYETAKILMIEPMKQRLYYKMNGITPPKSKNTKRVRIHTAALEWYNMTTADTSKSDKAQKRHIIVELKAITSKFCDEIDQKFVDSLYANMASRGLQEGSQKFIISKLKAFLNFCIRYGYYTVEAKNKLVFKRQKDSERTAEAVISPAEFERILKASPESWRMYLKVLWNTGCRVNEAWGIERKGINPEKRTIAIYQTKVRGTKYVVLTQEFMNELQQYMKTHDANNPLLFPKRDYFIQNHGFKKLISKLGLRKEICLASIRTSYATNACAETGNLMFVKEQLGHASLKNTQRYMKFDTDKKIKILDKSKIETFA
jgi:integrase/recombinase XerD